MFLMNLGENTPFVFKHPYLFEELTCKFEGWQPELQKEFEELIQDLGGQVSNDATYIFTEYVYSKGKQDRSCYYSINFLSQSIETEVPLDIEKWRFTYLEQRRNPVRLGCCCYDITIILNAKACSSDNCNNIVCTQCVKYPRLHHSLSDGNSLLNDSSDNIKFNGSKNFRMISEKPIGGIDSINQWKRTKPLNIRDLYSSFESLKYSSDDSYSNEQIINNNVSQIANNIQSEPGVHSIDRWKTNGPISLKDLDLSSESSCKESCCNKKVVKNNMSKLSNTRKPETGVGSICQKIGKKQINVENAVTSSKNSSHNSCSDKKMSSTKTISLKKNDYGVSEISRNQNSEASIVNIPKQKRKLPKTFSDSSSESSSEELPTIASTFRSMHSTIRKRHRKPAADPNELLNVEFQKVVKVNPSIKKTLELKKIRSTNEETAKDPAKVEKIKSTNENTVEIEKNKSTKKTPKVKKIIPTYENTEESRNILLSEKNNNNISEILKNHNSEVAAGKMSNQKRKLPKSFSDSSSENSSEELLSIPSKFQEFDTPIRKKRYPNKKIIRFSKQIANSQVEMNILTNDETPELEIVEEISPTPKVITVHAKDSRIEQLRKGISGSFMKDIKEWWINLPPGFYPDRWYKEKERIFPERDYVDQDERIMIAYLVQNDLYDQFDKRKTWRRLHQDGYLRSRSIESLKAHIKVILSKIKTFGLPREIEKRFLSLNSE